MTPFSLVLFTTVLMSAFATGDPISKSKGHTPTIVHQFPNNTWIENTAIRKNGEILGTDLVNGKVYLVNPFIRQVVPPVIAHFDNKTGLAGISEVEDDVFYVQGINNSDVSKSSFPANSSSVWQIDLRCYESTGKARVKKVADILQIGTPNGMTTLSKQRGTILIADSTNGLVFKLDVKTGVYEVVIDDPVLKGGPGSKVRLGVNGIKVVKNILYFSNSHQSIIGTFSIDINTGHATGGPHIISSNLTFIDDFAVGSDGSVWAAENAANTLLRVFPNGETETVTGGEDASRYLNGPTSAKFGRTREDKDVLYISTDGKTSENILTSDGRIVSINTKPFLARSERTQ